MIMSSDYSDRCTLTIVVFKIGDNGMIDTRRNLIAVHISKVPAV